MYKQQAKTHRNKVCRWMMHGTVKMIGMPPGVQGPKSTLPIFRLVQVYAMYHGLQTTQGVACSPSQRRTSTVVRCVLGFPIPPSSPTPSAASPMLSLVFGFRLFPTPYPYLSFTASSPGGGMRHNIQGANEAPRKQCWAPWHMD